MSVYSELVPKVQAGDQQAADTLFRHVKKEYEYMVAVIPDQAQAEGVMRSAFSLTVAHIHEVVNPEVYGEWYRRTLEQSIARIPKQDLNDGHDQIKPEHAVHFVDDPAVQSQRMANYTQAQNAVNNAAAQAGMNGAMNMGVAPASNPAVNPVQAPNPTPAVTPAPVVNPAPVRTPAPVKKSKGPLIIGIIIAIIFVACAGLIAWKFLGDKDKDKDKDKDSNNTTTTAATTENGGFDDVDPGDYTTDDVDTEDYGTDDSVYCPYVNSSDGVLDEYFDAFSDHDMDRMLDCYPPGAQQKIGDSLTASVGVSTADEYWAYLCSGYGDDFVVSYTIADSTDISSLQCSQLADSLNPQYGTNFVITEAKKVTADESCVGSLYSYDFTEKLYVGVIDGRWYILGMALN